MAEAAMPRKKKRRTAGAQKEAGKASVGAAEPGTVSELLAGAFGSGGAGPGSVSELLSTAFSAKPEVAPAKKSSESQSSGSADALPEPAALDGTFSKLFEHGKDQAKKWEAEEKARKDAEEATAEAERVVRALRGKRNIPFGAVPGAVSSTASAAAVPNKPVDLDADMLKKKEKNRILTSEEQEEQDTRTLFIGNVPLEWNEKNLKAGLSAAVGDKYAGKYHPIWFRNQPVKEKWANPFTRRVGCIKMDYSMDAADDKCAFVVVNSKEAFEIVKKAVHGLKVDSTHILRADGIGAQSKYTSFDRKRSVFVGNLPRNTGEVDLRKVFEQCGEVSAVRVVRDTVTQQCRGIAFILYKDRGSVKPALELWGTMLRGREIRVDKVEATEEEGEGTTASWARKYKAKDKAWVAWRVEQKLQKMRKNASTKDKRRKAAAKRDGNTTINDRKKSKRGGGKLKMPKKAGKNTRTKATEAAGKLRGSKKKRM